MGQHTRTSAVLLCAQLGGSENSWKCLQCLKIPQNPGGLEAGRGEESSSGLSVPVSLSLMFYASLHKSSKLLCMCASMNAVVTPSNLMCSNQMMTPEEQKLACQDLLNEHGWQDLLQLCPKEMSSFSWGIEVGITIH